MTAGGLSRRQALAAALAATPLAAAAQTSATMLTRPIPKTGEALPVIGLGTSGVFEIGNDPAERAARAAIIRGLIAAGGKVIDTAPSYGSAEQVVGDLVAEAGVRRSVFLATKLESFAPAGVTARLRASLTRLRTDQVDLMQLHNVSDPHQDLGLLRDWKAQGGCRYVGITTTYHGDFAAAEAILRREKPDFLEVDYSLEDREVAKRLLPAAADNGVAVLVAMPFGGGGLLRGLRNRPLPAWASAFGAATWGQFLLKYLIGDPTVTAVIPGTGNPAHMADNLAAGHGRPPDAAERRRMVEFFASLG